MTNERHSPMIDGPEYRPGFARVGEPTPQTDPDLFTTDELTAEIRYLMAANRRYGSNALRTLAYIKLAKIRAQRPDWNPS
jgi:hypothetical protein